MESPLVCKKKQRCKRRLGAVAQRIAVLRTGWAHTSQKFAWATCVLRPFGTFSAKQRIPSLLFMLKSNKNLEPVSLWVPNLRTRGKGHKVSLSKPFPTDPKGYRKKRRGAPAKGSASIKKQAVLRPFYILLSFSRTASKAFVSVASKPFACNAATPSMVVPPGEQT